MEGIDLVKLSPYSDDLLPCNLDDQFDLCESQIPKVVELGNGVEVKVDREIDGWQVEVSVPDGMDVEVKSSDG